MPEPSQIIGSTRFLKRERTQQPWLVYLIPTMVIAIVVTSCVGPFAYMNWYDRTLPDVPIPPLSRMLRRNPADKPYDGSFTARNWYQLKFSSKLSPQEVADFYDCTIVAETTTCSGYARPFGGYTVNIITPLTHSPSPAEMKLLNDYSDPLAYLREINDPLGETLILIEVTWPTNPWPLPNG